MWITSISDLILLTSLFHLNKVGHLLYTIIFFITLRETIDPIFTVLAGISSLVMCQQINLHISFVVLEFDECEYCK